MLATMRPTQIHTSSSSLTTTTQRTPSAQPQIFSPSSVKKSNKPMAAKASPRGKQDAPSPAPRPAPVQSTPGLLTLSKPLESYSAESTDEGGTAKVGKKKKKKSQPSAATVHPQGSADGVASSARAQRSKKQNALNAVKADERILSHSAPTGSADDGWDMPARDTSSSTLTWQQQLLASQQTQKPGGAERKKENKKAKGATGAAAAKREHSAAAKESALTWQQELLSSNKPRGQTYDVFADAKDAATFGGGATQHASSKAKRNDRQNRQRADSLGEIEVARQASKRGANGGVQLGSGQVHSSSSGPPSTPNKLAYAGPNFHNSPSPASLPVPKFLQSKGAANIVSGISPSVSAHTMNQSSSLAREAMNSASDSGEDEADHSFHHSHNDPNRFARGVTAPPELSANANANANANPSSGDDGARSMTIENLLAKMMRPGAQ